MVGTAQRRLCPPSYGRTLPLHQRRLAIDREQHAFELVAAAQDQPGRRDHAVHTLLAGEPRILFDSIDRNLGGAAEYREHRALSEEIDSIVAPLAIGDHAAVEIQNAIKFETVERHPVR